jgi:SAM-dependent methyltransferase
MQHDAPPAAGLTDPLALCRAGAISPEVALARLLFSGVSPAEIAGRLGADDAAIRALLDRQGLAAVGAMLAEVDHETPHDVAAMRAIFDAAVARAPEASVAAFSLGDPAILARATAELVAWLQAEALLGPECDVLDLGCGIGRVAAAIAPRVRSVLALDVSPAMIAEARRRHGSVPGLRFGVTSGTDLGTLSAGVFDLILAVDSFPYLVQAGVAERHVADAKHLLRPGGTLAILNLSYRGGEADRADARRWAAEHGFALGHEGDRCFTLWDGVAFTLRR